MKRLGRLAVSTCALLTLVLAATAANAQIAAKPVRVLERSEGDVLAVAFSADGKYICAGGERGVVYCWDADTGEIANTVTAHLRAAVFSVVTYPLAPVAVHASELGIKFHLVGGRGKVPTFPFKHMQTVFTLDFSKDGELMASGDRGGETIVWNLWTGQPYRRFQAGKREVNSVRFHPEGNRLATAMNGGKVLVRDVKADKLLYEIAAHEGESNSVAFSPDGKLLATAGKDKKVKLWNAADGKPVAVLEGHLDAVNVVLFRPKGAPWLASGSDDKTLCVWDFSSKKLLQTLAHDKAVNALSWRADGAMLATGAGTLVQLFEVK